MKKLTGKIDYAKIQFCAGHGRESSMGGDSIWHTNSKGEYWSGRWYYKTPEELYRESLSIVADLLRNHPELANGGKLT